MTINYFISNRKLFSFFVCCYSLSFFLWNINAQNPSGPSLNSTDLLYTISTNSTEIELNSSWEFYWNQLIEPTDFDSNKIFSKKSLDSWTSYSDADSNLLPSFGFATYRLVFYLSEDRVHSSLYIPKAYSASKIWINGKLISEIGKVGKTKSETIHRRYDQMIPLDDHDSTFEIVIQVSNFYHSQGGFNQPLILASSQRLDDVISKRIIADMLFIGCLGFIGMFFLLFYLFYWSKDKAILYFALMCLGLCYMAISDRYAPIAAISDTINWILLTKIEYFALFVAGASAGLFINTIFHQFTHQAFHKIVKYGFIVLVVVLTLLPSPYFTKLILPFLILMIIKISYVLYIIAKAILVGKRKESVLLLVSTILGAIVFSFHILAFIGKDSNAIIYVNIGYVLVFLLLSMLLMNRFSKSFGELESTKEVALQQKNEISIKSKALAEVNTELKENLKQLENYNSELDGFNRIVSHDLKAPLVAMHSLVSFIEEDTKTKVDKDTKQHFELLKERISKMDNLINGLLEYSKIARGNKEKHRFNFNKLLLEIFETINTSNGNTINLPTEDIEICANRIELKHVFQNLISNAIKHNDKDKTVITVDLTKRTHEYEFSLTDNGPGIEKKYHNKIFEMFSQINTKREVESTGIGLSIVKRIVLENRGEIKVESKKDVGTTIRFTWASTN